MHALSLLLGALAMGVLAAILMLLVVYRSMLSLKRFMLAEVRKVRTAVAVSREETEALLASASVLHESSVAGQVQIRKEDREVTGDALIDLSTMLCAEHSDAVAAIRRARNSYYKGGQAAAAARLDAISASLRVRVTSFNKATSLFNVVISSIPYALFAKRLGMERIKELK